MRHNKVLIVLTEVIIMVVFFYVGYTNSANYKLEQRITPMENKNNSSVYTINQMYLKYEAELGF